MSQIAAFTVKPVADAPCPGHGDTMAKPRPEPNASSTIEAAMATNAPAKIAGQDAADLLHPDEPAPAASGSNGPGTREPGGESITCCTEAPTGESTWQATR
jgi:hypothetical protein